MTIQKIILLIALASYNQISIASNYQKLSEFYKKTSRALAGYKKYGIQIGDINELGNHAALIDEMHDTILKDNTPVAHSKQIVSNQANQLLDNGQLLDELFDNAQSKIFGRHLIHHFGKDTLINFITIIEQHGPEASQVLEIEFEQAFNNYFKSRITPKVKPQSYQDDHDKDRAMICYLVALRDQEK